MRGLPLGIVVHLFIGKARGRTNEFASTAGFPDSAQLLREAVKKGGKSFAKARRFAYCRSMGTGVLPGHRPAPRDGGSNVGLLGALLFPLPHLAPKLR